MRRVLHGIEVIQIAEELVEAVNRGKKLVSVAEVVLAKLTGGIAASLQRRGDRTGFRREAEFRARLSDRGHTRADGKLSGNEVGATRRAACFGVVIGEEHALLGKLVEIRR